eukprot:TRINITY_DN2544_c0_g1_i1.p1 TRINITY_DN2544_c0_g1~~TRINITY_DN2544_c0_g1_i1.p1  ORF type:complete len:136 (-),score=27.15 TRINITY_DN2544_c0_g1_i1:146-553(-)
MEAWQGYLYYIFTALNKIPKWKGYVYRGIRAKDREVVATEYEAHRRISWSAFTSASARADVAARMFASQGSGVVFRIKLESGRDISDLSAVGRGESEILLSPNSQFVVVDEPSPNGKIVELFLVEVQQSQDPFRF